MTRNRVSPEQAEPAPARAEETPFEAIASTCSVLVVGLFILTFCGPELRHSLRLYEDHAAGGAIILLVDRITLAPSARWMPLVHYREPQRGDIVVFLKPVADTDKDGNNARRIYPCPCKAAGGCSGRSYSSAQRHRHSQQAWPSEPTSDAQDAPPNPGMNHSEFLDEFPAVPP